MACLYIALMWTVGKTSSRQFLDCYACTCPSQIGCACTWLLGTGAWHYLAAGTSATFCWFQDCDWGITSQYLGSDELQLMLSWISVMGRTVSISLVSYYGLLIYNSCSEMGWYHCFGGTHCPCLQGWKKPQIINSLVITPSTHACAHTNICIRILWPFRNALICMHCIGNFFPAHAEYSVAMVRFN
jgi:hypothetical protein